MLYGVALSSALAAGVTMAAHPGGGGAAVALFLRERITAAPGGRRHRLRGGTASRTLAAARNGSAAGTGCGCRRWGIALLLGAVFCEASLRGHRQAAHGARSRHGGSARSSTCGAWLLVTPLGSVAGLVLRLRRGAAPATWGLLVFYALAASVVTVWLWMQGLREVPAPRAGVFSVLLPVSAALVGVMGLGEPFTTGHAWAFGFALAGLLLATWPAAAAPAGPAGPAGPAHRS
jgi:drug/metabolite transporter (DMT)-like permease